MRVAVVPDSAYVSNMLSMSDRARQALAALGEAVDALAGLDSESLGVGERLEMMQTLETAMRRQTAVSHTVGAALQRCDNAALGGICHKVIADVLRISPRESARRLRDADRLAPRHNLTGQVLPAALPATAAAWHNGTLAGEHLRVITRFFTELPQDLPADKVAWAEAFLADKAADLRPDQLGILADRLAIRLNPDGHFSDEDRARKRGFTWSGRQRPDGMSTATLTASPELRATIDALLAKFAAPGMVNPADQTPLIEGEPTPDRAATDTRTTGQRQHDALLALLRDRLGDPRLGQHRGLPVTIIASATVQDISNQTGYAVTAGGTLLPMTDLIRIASPAWHYLSIFDGVTGRALWLGRTKRLATADQRAVLHSRDRGCTAPGCDKPGYLTEGHHITDWAAGGRTDIDALTLACKTHNLWVTEYGWTTRRNPDGTTEWIPPPHLPLSGGTNTYHHPERLLPERLPPEAGEDR